MRNEVLRLVLNVGPGYENFYADTKQYGGEINRIGFKFPYYMVFVHKGAGRGYGGLASLKRFKDAGNSAAIWKQKRMGSGRRKAKPFFNPVIEAELPQLADIITDHKGQKAIDRIQNAFNKLKID